MKNKGFTLIEMLIAITLFSFIITAALGALFSILKNNEIGKNIKTAVDNLNITLDGISRELRVGYDYKCYPNDYSQECTHITFKTKKDCNGEYWWDKNTQTIKRKIEIKEGNNCVNRDGSGVDLNSQNVKITYFKFNIKGNLDKSPPQPRILIRIKGETNNPINGKKINFNIQTTVSQRTIEE